MKNLISTFLISTIILPLQLLATQANSPKNIEHLFSGSEGCFLLYNLTEDRYDYDFNAKLSDCRFSPCSTFKIPNSLIALEESAVEDENEYFPWDNTPQPYSWWEKPHNLSTAIQGSVVWFYQRIAQKIGMEKYKTYLSQINYGNQNPTSDLTRFWLQGSLEISPKEQVLFLNKLYRNQLPFSERTMETVKKILVLEEREQMRFSGKTGTAKGNELAWFVGHLSVNDKEYTFATFIKEKGISSGPKAKQICKNILSELEIL